MYNPLLDTSEYEQRKVLMEEIRTQFKAKFHKFFPNSSLIFTLSSLCSDRGYVRPYLGSGESEMINGIYQNDPLNIMLSVDIQTPTQIVFSGCHSSIAGLRPDNPHHVYSSRKVPFRKCTGNLHKITVHWEKYLEKLYTTLVDIDNNQLLISKQPYDLKSKLATEFCG